MSKYERKKVTRWQEGEVERVQDDIVVESSLELVVNGQEVATLLSSPDKMKELGLGFLMTEGLIDSVGEVEEVNLEDSGKRLEITLDGSEPLKSYFERKRALTSSCGMATSVIENLDRLELVGVGPEIENPGKLSDFMRELQSRAKLFQKTGGSHTAALADREELVCLAEDIGRHNAVDKAIGKGMLIGDELSTKILLTSGRLSSEMTLKAIRSRVPVVVSRSAPTTLAVRIARTASITMVGFTRGKRMTFYSGEERVLR
ncbi:MAG: formate dehydrogenase accessory sulfurtransferase FdhD [Candidatus Acetothermia bacterium]